MRAVNSSSLRGAVWFCGLIFCSVIRSVAAVNATGLWVGEAVLNKVNETVVGIDAANQTVAPDPSVTTPVQSPAHLQVIVHVDSQGQARLLKSVAVLAKSTNQPPDLALITDSTLYPNFNATGVGKRIASAAFDFGDAAANQILQQLATNAAVAAATGGNPTNAANSVVQNADVDAAYIAFASSSGLSNAASSAASASANAAVNRALAAGTQQQVISDAFTAATNNPVVVSNRAYALSLQAASLLPDGRYITAVGSVSAAAANSAAATVNGGQTNLGIVTAAANTSAQVALSNAVNASSVVSPGYKAFISTPTFQGSAAVAAAAAAAAAAQAAGQPAAVVQGQAYAAALKALTDAGIVAAADGIVDNEVKLSGAFAPGGGLAGTIYLGASHPTNPFRHRRHPDHTIGYAITRAVSIQFDPATGTNSFLTAGFGVDRITGSYREAITGLHKPLGPGQNIGLITDGTIVLNRVSPVDTLNR
jgi:hypothetical protein